MNTKNFVMLGYILVGNIFNVNNAHLRCSLDEKNPSFPQGF